MQLKWSVMLRVDLGPVTVVWKNDERTTDRHRLREQGKVPGSLLEGSVPLTKKCEDCDLSWKKKADLGPEYCSKISSSINPTNKLAYWHTYIKNLKKRFFFFNVLVLLLCLALSTSGSKLFYKRRGTPALRFQAICSFL